MILYRLELLPLVHGKCGVLFFRVRTKTAHKVGKVHSRRSEWSGYVPLAGRCKKRVGHLLCEPLKLFGLAFLLGLPSCFGEQANSYLRVVALSTDDQNGLRMRLGLLQLVLNLGQRLSWILLQLANR